MRVRFWILALALSVATSGLALAQVHSGSISGSVTDAQGGVLPGVTVTMTSADRTATFVTEDDGRFRFLALPPGMYPVTATLQGFSTVVHERIEVALARALISRFSFVSRRFRSQSPSPVTRQSLTPRRWAPRRTSRRTSWPAFRRRAIRGRCFARCPGVVARPHQHRAATRPVSSRAIAPRAFRRANPTWTIDGVNITDAAAVGASPTYFDYDAFDEIMISTAGSDIKQPTGGVGLNFVVKRGTNQYRGGFKGYYTNDDLEASNIPAELAATGVTSATADHNDEIMEWGGDVGGPILKDKLWFWASYVEQDIRLYRRQVARHRPDDPEDQQRQDQLAGDQEGQISFLWFNGDKVKNGRRTGFSGIEARTATWNQGNFYTDGTPHGLLKIQDNRVFSSTFFLSGKYAYYNTGFTLDPIGGLDIRADRAPGSPRPTAVDPGSVLPPAAAYRQPRHQLLRLRIGRQPRFQDRLRLAPIRHLQPRSSTLATWCSPSTTPPSSTCTFIERGTV